MENAVKPKPALKPGQLFKYDTVWNAQDDLDVEMSAIRLGGRWKNQEGVMCGNGLFDHWKRYFLLLWPTFEWQRWSELLLKVALGIVPGYEKLNEIIAVLGPKSSGKTFFFARWSVAYYWLWPEHTCILCSSTELTGLRLRIWGDIITGHAAGKQLHPWLSGRLTDSKLMLTTESDDETVIRDRRQGLIGLPCKKGNTWVGVGCFPSGTMVDTPSGTQPIESIKPGDYVTSAIGEARVRDTQSRSADTLVRITTNNGRTIECTPEHPILTSSGWVNAIDLRSHHELISPDETMYRLRNFFEGNQNANWATEEILFHQVSNGHMDKTMQGVRSDVQTSRSEGDFLLSTLLVELECKTTFNDCEAEGVQITYGQGGPWKQNTKLNHVESQGKAQEKHSHEEAGLSDCGSKTSAGNESMVELRSRTQRHSSRGFTETTFSGCKTQLLDQNGEVIQVESDARVLHRLGVATNPNGGRGRWIIPFSAKPSSERQVEGQVFERVRVDSVEILQRGSDERYDPSRGGYTVHNLEIEGHPSYSVNGIVVHNSYQGIKQDRMILIADEAQIMPFGFLDAEANLNVNPIHHFILLGNPIGQGDALERVYEPDPSEGSLETLIDYTDPKTKVWKTTWSGGIAVNLPGCDSPNFDVPEDAPVPYPKLVTRARIAKDAHSYGKESWKYFTFSIGIPPRGVSTFRVITMEKCKQFGAFEDFIWETPPSIRFMALDAAYGGVGGDRCVAGEAWVGRLVGGEQVIALIGGPILVPVKASQKKEPEDQIAEFMLNEMNARGISLTNHLFYDSTGRGSLGTAFARVGIMPSPVEFGGKPSDRPIRKGEKKTCREEYFNFVSELWFQSALLIESGQCRGITKEMVREAQHRTWELVGSAGMQKTQVAPKKEMKELLGCSPDEWDMWVVAVEGARRLGFSIRAIGEEHKKNNQQWLHDLRKQSLDLKKHRQLVYSR